MPLTVVTTGRLIAYRNASEIITAFSLTAVPSPPRLFIARVAAVRAHLRHEEHAVAAILQRASHSFLALPVVVFPRVVHEGDASVDRFVHDPRRFALGLHLPEVKAAQRHDGDLLIEVSPERSRGNRHERDRTCRLKANATK